MKVPSSGVPRTDYVYKTPFGLSCPLTFVPSLSWQMIVFHEEVYTEKERSGARDRGHLWAARLEQFRPLCSRLSVRVVQVVDNPTLQPATW
jgi:hypothetical protein